MESSGILSNEGENFIEVSDWESFIYRKTCRSDKVDMKGSRHFSQRIWDTCNDVTCNSAGSRGIGQLLDTSNKVDYL